MARSFLIWGLFFLVAGTKASTWKRSARFRQAQASVSGDASFSWSGSTSTSASSASGNKVDNSILNLGTNQKRGRGLRGGVIVGAEGRVTRGERFSRRHDSSTLPRGDSSRYEGEFVVGGGVDASGVTVGSAQTKNNRNDCYLDEGSSSSSSGLAVGGGGVLAGRVVAGGGVIAGGAVVAGGGVVTGKEHSEQHIKSQFDDRASSTSGSGIAAGGGGIIIAGGGTADKHTSIANMGHLSSSVVSSGRIRGGEGSKHYGPNADGYALRRGFWGGAQSDSADGYGSGGGVIIGGNGGGAFRGGGAQSDSADGYRPGWGGDGGRYWGGAQSDSADGYIPNWGGSGGRRWGGAQSDSADGYRPGWGGNRGGALSDSADGFYESGGSGGAFAGGGEGSRLAVLH